MGSEKKYYWLKLQRDFFKRHDVRIIEEMENGKDYLLFYLKLLVESLDHNGNLRFSDTVPYNERMLSVVTNTNVDIVRSALKVFTDLKMIEILQDETIYMTEVEKMIGSAADNDNAKRQQRFRERQKSALLEDSVTKNNACVTECVTNNNESKSKNKSKSIDIEKDIDNTPLNPPKGKGKKSNLILFNSILEKKPSVFSDKVISVLREWMEYKDQKKDYYVERGLSSILNQVYKAEKEHGSDAVVECVRNSMANNYKGIILDKLNGTPKKQTGSSLEEWAARKERELNERK